MTPKLVFVIATALGAASASSAAIMMAHDRSLTAERPPLVREFIHPLPAQGVPEFKVLEAIELTPELVKVERRAPAVTAPAEKKPLAPCSPWQELGPTHVNDGAASGTRNVRELC